MLRRRNPKGGEVVYILLGPAVLHVGLGRHLVSLSNNHTQCAHAKRFNDHVRRSGNVLALMMSGERSERASVRETRDT